jgi:hypothetical protein
VTRAVVEAPVVAPSVRPSQVPEEPAPRAEQTLVNPTPATRAPMSVQPEPRPAFPNQDLPELGDDDRGGLLGGGGLL